MTHTPGPWHIFTELDTDEEITANVGILHRPPGGEQHVCKVHTWGAGYECDREAQANAALIAAAPDLLEALSYLLAQCKGYDELGHPIAQAMQDARAAIAKARGESY